MKFRHILLCVATVAALSPVIATASPEQSSVKACASAFASTITPSGAVTPGYKLAYRDSLSGSVVDFYRTDYSFTMVANDAKTGLPIARARCSTNTHGAVTEIASLPLDQRHAPLAAALN